MADEDVGPDLAVELISEAVMILGVGEFSWTAAGDALLDAAETAFEDGRIEAVQRQAVEREVRAAGLVGCTRAATLEPGEVKRLQIFDMASRGP